MGSSLSWFVWTGFGTETHGLSQVTPSGLNPCLQLVFSRTGTQDLSDNGTYSVVRKT